MELTIYGCRGSYPMARRDVLSYGGNSTCIHIRSASGQEIIIDGGSGIRGLGEAMMRREFGSGKGEAHILVGHTHWDHILGYPFFDPLYQEGNRFVFVSAGQTDAHIKDILSGQHDDIHFPVPFADLRAEMDYQAFKPGEAFQIGDFRVETVQLNHPGITVGYRIEADGRVATVYTDNARVRKVRLGDGQGGPEPDPAFTRLFLDSLSRTARASDVFIHDTHFFEHEMMGRYHWGHSTVEDALELAVLAEVKRLVLFHHAPEHSDTVVDEKLFLARDLSREFDFKVDCAFEGLTYKVGEAEGEREGERNGDEEVKLKLNHKRRPEVSS